MEKSSFLDRIHSWLRWNFSWSRSKETWRDIGIFSLLLIYALGVWRLEDRLALVPRLLLWGLLLIVLIVLVSLGWVRLFGPVLFYDLVRAGRRGRYFFVRVLYALVLLALLLLVNAIWSLKGSTLRENEIERMALMAEMFFATFITIQLLTVLLLTPAYTAGAIAEEKDKKTLEFLLATDLCNREIVLGKLVARLANLSLILLAGLPILCLIQFLGGVDPNLLLASFAATAVTMASLTSLGILLSVYARKPRDAIVSAYLWMAAYLGLSSLCLYLAGDLWPDVGKMTLPFGENPITVLAVVEGLNAGNIFVAFGKLASRVAGGGRLSDGLGTMLHNYTIFHCWVFVVCTVLAVARLRGVALKQAQGLAGGLYARIRLWFRPGLRGRPMLWKEVFVEPGVRYGWLGRVLLILLVLLSFAPALWLWTEYSAEVQQIVEGAKSAGSPLPAEKLAQGINMWVRVAGSVVACLTLLGVAAHAASTIGRERDRQTLESLLTSPLESDEIFYSKWLGSLLSVRWGWLWLGAIWGTGVFLGGLYPLALPALLLAWLVLACFLASVGLWFSIVCRTSFRATVWTMATAAFVGAGHWLILFPCCYLFLKDAGGKDVERLFEFHTFGLTPPFMLGSLAVQGSEFEYQSERHFLVFALVGMSVWAGACAVVWSASRRRLRKLSGR